MANRWGTNGDSERLYFGGPPKSLYMVTAVMKLKDPCSLKEKTEELKKVLMKVKEESEKVGLKLNIQ